MSRIPIGFRSNCQLAFLADRVVGAKRGGQYSPSAASQLSDGALAADGRWSGVGGGGVLVWREGGGVESRRGRGGERGGGPSDGGERPKSQIQNLIRNVISRGEAFAKPPRHARSAARRTPQPPPPHAQPLPDDALVDVLRRGVAGVSRVVQDVVRAVVDHLQVDHADTGAEAVDRRRRPADREFGDGLGLAAAVAGAVDIERPSAATAAIRSLLPAGRAIRVRLLAAMSYRYTAQLPPISLQMVYVAQLPLTSPPSAEVEKCSFFCVASTRTECVARL